MHVSALKHGQLFFDTYLGREADVTIVDIGAQDINGSLRHGAPAGCRYIGVDFVPGPGVDVVLDDPYRLPFADASVDVVVSSSCFEHIEFFWLMFNEALRVLAPGGLLYLNAPANGDFHRYPVDCWQFYPRHDRLLCLSSGESSLFRPSIASAPATAHFRLNIYGFYKTTPCMKFFAKIKKILHFAMSTLQN
jgi:SAM-dependent methyltransferase